VFSLIGARPKARNPLQVFVDPRRIEMPHEAHLQARASVLPLLRFRCGGCGYCASCRRAPDRCPICGACAWEDDGWKPLADIGAELGVVARPAARRAGFDADAPLVREAEELSVFPGGPLS
jgi:hypothetical protein